MSVTGLHLCVSPVVPIPTFILGPLSPEYSSYYDNVSGDGGELCDNITCLGRCNDDITKCNDDIIVNAHNFE